MRAEDALLDDVDALADAVTTTLLLDDNLRTKLVEAATRTAATMDWSASTDTFREALATRAGSSWSY